MFNFIKNKLTKVYNQFTSKVNTIFSKKQINESSLKELEIILLSADTGIKTTRTIVEQLKEQHKQGKIQEGESLKAALEKQLLEILSLQAKPELSTDQKVYLLVGINGSGKTTFAAKLANKYKQNGKKVLLVAADTFRAAATEQLEKWARSTGVEIITGTENQDPASVVFKGCEKYKAENFDVIIIDTAGRLQTKINLMKELEKIKKIIKRHLPNETINTLLTIDAMLGQNSLEQAKIFHEATDVSGIILTKMDGTAKEELSLQYLKNLVYQYYLFHLEKNWNSLNYLMHKNMFLNCWAKL